MQKVLKPENKHICINARSRKPANKLVQVVNDGGMNRASREGKASAEKLSGGLRMLREYLSPFLQGCTKGLSHSRGQRCLPTK